MSLWDRPQTAASRTKAAAYRRLHPLRSTYEVSFTVGTDDATVGSSTDMFELSEAITAIVQNVGGLRTLDVALGARVEKERHFDRDFFDAFARRTPRTPSACSIAAEVHGDENVRTCRTEDRDQLVESILEVVNAQRPLQHLSVLIEKKAS